MLIFPLNCSRRLFLKLKSGLFLYMTFSKCKQFIKSKSLCVENVDRLHWGWQYFTSFLMNSIEWNKKVEVFNEIDQNWTTFSPFSGHSPSQGLGVANAKHVSNGALCYRNDFGFKISKIVLIFFAFYWIFFSRIVQFFLFLHKWMPLYSVYFKEVIKRRKK